MHLVFYNNLSEKKSIISFDIKGCPKFTVSKIDATVRGTNSSYKLVSDTAGNQFKCIDFTFLPRYCNSAIMKTFIPISAKEKAVFEILQKVSQSGDYKLSLKAEEVERFIGWVRILYSSTLSY